MQERIEQIVDSKSYGIMEYARQLDRQINLSPGLTGTIADYKTPLPPKNTICLYHFSNATRGTLLHLLKNRGGRNIVIIHDTEPRSAVVKRLHPLFLRIINHRADRLVAHTEAARQRLTELNPLLAGRKIEVIPHGTEIIDAARGEVEALRRKYGYKREEKVLFKLGGITGKRGHINFIKAFAGAGLKNLRLIVAGVCKDTRAAAIMKKCGAIDYLGFADNDRVEECYKLCDGVVVFRTNTVAESSSTIVYGLGHGKPVLASDFPSFAEIIGDCGVLFQNDADSLKKMLTGVATGRVDLEGLKGKALGCRKDYSWEIYLRKLLK